MELWIRSQNKDGLAKIHSISIEEKTSTKFSIVGNSEWILGIYETEERALEVLDEIQNILMPRITYTPIVEEDIKPQYTYRHFISEKGETNILELSTYVYDMPQE